MPEFEIIEYYTKEDGNAILSVMPRDLAVGLIMVYTMETHKDPETFADVLNFVCSDPDGIKCNLKSEYDAALEFVKGGK